MDLLQNIWLDTNNFLFIYIIDRFEYFCMDGCYTSNYYTILVTKRWASKLK